MFDSVMELTSEEGWKAILSLITSVISDHPGVIFAALLVVAILLILPMVSSSTPSHWVQVKMSTNIKVNLQFHFHVGSLEVNLAVEENVEVKNFPFDFCQHFSQLTFPRCRTAITSDWTRRRPLWRRRTWRRWPMSWKTISSHGLHGFSCLVWTGGGWRGGRGVGEWRGGQGADGCLGSVRQLRDRR